jgi:hypothetical protein
MSKYISLGASALFLILLAAFGYQTHRVDTLNRDLDAARLQATDNLRIANQNNTILERIKNDFNASLNDCYQGYKKLSDSFDRYRRAIAVKTEIAPVSEALTCVIGGSTISKALNGINDEQ